LLCIMHLALYLFRKLPMNFSDEAYLLIWKETDKNGRLGKIH
jgi:hypothetical protein